MRTDVTILPDHDHDHDHEHNPGGIILEHNARNRVWEIDNNRAGRHHRDGTTPPSSNRGLLDCIRTDSFFLSFYLYFFILMPVP